MTGKLFCIGLLLLLVSCSLEQSTEKEIEAEQNTAHSIHRNRKNPSDSLMHYAFRVPEPSNSERAKAFQTLTDFPNTWISLSQNDLGFFIYHHGPGLASTLHLTSDSLHYGGYGEPSSWRISKFEVLKENTYQFSLGNILDPVFAKASIEILDLDTLYALHKVDIYEAQKGEKQLLHSYSGLYIPKEKQHLFYHIKEPNTNSPDRWIPQNEIDLKGFVDRKN
jgi:hypothetical protein